MFKGLIRTTEGLMDANMKTVNDINDVKELNLKTSKTMGFKFMYGKTSNNEIIEFVKGGNWCKRDIENIKKFNILRQEVHHL